MTTDRHDPDAIPELSDEFWGEQTEWTPQSTPSAVRDGLGATIGRWWDRLLGGDADAERSHGAATAPLSTDEVPDDGDESAWAIEPERVPERRGGVDPLIARLGGLAVIVTLAAPLVVGFTASDDASSAADTQLVVAGDATEGSLAEPATPGAGIVAAAAAPIDPTSAAPAASGATAATGSPTSSSDESGAAPTELSAAATASLEQAPDAEPVASEPAATTPPCGARYELAAGDYWIRVADAAGVSLSDLLGVNEASVDTVLVPGRSICLPVGAGTPAPPTSAPSTPAPARTAPSNTSAPRSAPATTVAPRPATTAPSRPAAVSQSRAAQIIRAVWPDELEERALEIAWRESNHQSNVNNSCCYGLFQIHWNAHRSWLATIGVTSVTQLYDPMVNATAAYTLYQRAGGFGPWGG
ncbi:MAG TPA: hypothetical protein VMY16_10935 [Ilumatobacteraceae bacterium]|nr:hypothetical protein [Ilumatobacteraceae bacterium]